MFNLHLIILLCFFGFQKFAFNSTFENSTKKTFITIPEQSKNGYHIEYLDKYFNILLDKKNAKFYRYVYFDNGIRIGEKFTLKRKQSLESVYKRPINDSTSVLDGIYRVRGKKGSLISEESYNEGKLVYSKSFHKSGQLYEFIDYSAKYENQEGSYTITIYENYPEPDQIYFYGKLNGHWQLIKRYKKW